MTATYRVVAMVTGDGRRIQAFERIEDRPTMGTAPPPHATGRPRESYRVPVDRDVERRRSQYRASKERARHAAGRCAAAHGVPCEIADPITVPGPKTSARTARRSRRQAEIAAAVTIHGSMSATARALGIAASTVRISMRRFRAIR